MGCYSTGLDEQRGQKATMTRTSAAGRRGAEKQQVDKVEHIDSSLSTMKEIKPYSKKSAVRMPLDFISLACEADSLLI
jgi:hypothetical protein